MNCVPRAGSSRRDGLARRVGADRPLRRFGQPRDGDLLERWRHGCGISGDTLFRRHHDAIRRFFRRRARWRDVDDLVQQTFEGCVVKSMDVQITGSFQRYLFGIARNQLLRYIDAQSRCARRRGAIDQSAIRDLGPSASSQLVCRQTEVLLRVALRSLTAEQQRLLELRYWEEQSPTEMADALGIERGLVRVRLHRARRKLRDVLLSTPAAGDFIDCSVRPGLARGRSQTSVPLRPVDRRPKSAQTTRVPEPRA